MLEVKAVSKDYSLKGSPDCAAVSNVSFMLPEHRICSLVGESGSGKSTLARLMTGLEAPTKGTVLLDGKPLSRRNHADIRCLASAIQLVLQDGKSSLNPRFTVYESVAEPMRNLFRMTREEEKLRIKSLLERMELPENIAEKKTGALSGGQQKRVCIARALAASPRYIIFDESLSGLDVILRKAILELLKKIQREENCAFLFITHEIEVALYLSDQIFVMKDGKIVEHCNWRKDLSVFQHPYSKQLLHASHII